MQHSLKVKLRGLKHKGYITPEEYERVKEALDFQKNSKLIDADEFKNKFTPGKTYDYDTITKLIDEYTGKNHPEENIPTAKETEKQDPERIAEIVCMYKYKTNEKKEAQRIVKILQKQGFKVNFFDNTSTDTVKECFSDCEFAVAAIEWPKGFHYYLIQSSGDDLKINDFNHDVLPKSKEKENQISSEVFLYYLMRFRLNDQLDSHVSYMLLDGYCIRTTKNDEGKYELKPVSKTQKALQIKSGFVYSLVECPACHTMQMSISGNTCQSCGKRFSKK